MTTSSRSFIFARAKMVEEMHELVNQWIADEVANPKGAITVLSEAMFVEFLIRELGDSLRDPLESWYGEFKQHVAAESGR